MRVFLGALAAAVLAGTGSAPAEAHGGQYKSPAAPNDDVPGLRPGAASPDWTDWWSEHRARYLRRARSRHREAVASAGGLAAGDGPSEPLPEAAAPSPRPLYERLVLPVVTKALEDPDGEVRSAAAIALGKMGFPRSLLDLRRHLSDVHPDVRDGSILALGMIGDGLAIDHLRSILRNPAERERTRGFAALSLGLLRSDEGAAELIAFLSPASDADRVGGLRKTPDLVACAVMALGHSGSLRAAPELRALYASATRLEPVPRGCAAVALARLGDREAIPLLLKGMAHSRAAMRQCGALALGAVGRPGDEAVLAALAKAAAEDVDDGTRRFALLAIGRIGGDGARVLLRRLYGEAKVVDRGPAALALGIAGDAPSAPLLRIQFRSGGEAGPRGAAATALGLLGDPDAAPSLREEAFGQGDPKLRAYCLAALALLGDAGAVPGALRVLRTESDPVVRLAAVECLAILGDGEALPVLRELARKGESVSVRSHACYQLGVFGGPDAARTLVEAVEDRGEEMPVRMYAVAGLGVLADRSPFPMLAGLGAAGNHFLGVDPLREVATFL
jgi:HEAT repeat protein